VSVPPRTPPQPQRPAQPQHPAQPQPPGPAGSPAPAAGEASEPLRVAVLGASGRMGTQACRAVEAAEDLELVATVGRGDDLAAALADSLAQVAVDLTVPAATADNVRTCVRAGVHAVVGTTGWTADRLDALRADLADRPDVGVLVAPNFALGAVLLLRLAEQAARWFESAEVVELHHPDKVDAPSGTARLTASRIAAARRAAGWGHSPDATSTTLPGARGADVDGVHVHAVRLRGRLASEEVLFGGPGETLTLRHDSMDRTSFMPGLLLAVRTVPARPGLTVGLEHYLDLG
jgi:4-hydroxy-tetrahydrodipicolinate reductase